MSSKNQTSDSDRLRAEVLRLRTALHDRTTGLSAFPLLFDVIRGHLDHRRHIGVLHVEIAELELVESLYGWQVFDRILERVASVLREAVDDLLPSETLLGIDRVGGDRFVAFLPADAKGREVNVDYLARVCDRLGAALESAFRSKEFEGLSPSLAFLTGYAPLSEDPFYRFERRVYGAVEEARTLSARRERRREASWRAELRRIIRDSAVSTVFQPVVDLDTREVIGVEALTRGPKQSFFEMPRAMFALSNRVGVGVDLDRLCRDTALRECGRLARRGKVFLNVLPDSLADPAWLSEEVGELLDAASIRPEDLVLEVSERAADPKLGRFVEAARRLRERGFAIALDDVGTGYATLATLEKIKPQYLKVDESVVRGIHNNLIKQELLSSLVQIARRIGARVIAEGVESEDEASVLRDAGADHAQGYLFSLPGSAGGGTAEGGAEAVKR